MQPTAIRLRHPGSGSVRTVSEPVAEMLHAHGWVADAPEPVLVDEKPKRKSRGGTTKPATTATATVGALPAPQPEPEEA